MLGKKFWVVWVIVCALVAYSRLTKQSISTDSQGKSSKVYSFSESISKEVEASERFRKSCESLGLLREKECLKKESEFSECLKKADFKFVNKFENAIRECIEVNAPH